MQIADMEGDGTISLDEFIKFMNMLSLDEGHDEAAMKEVFSSIDENGSGTLSQEEFGQAIWSAFQKANEAE